MIFRKKEDEVSGRVFKAVGTIQLFIPLVFAIIYPNVGSILSWTGSIAGLVIIYILPVIIYLKMLKTKLKNPLFAKALDENFVKLGGTVDKQQ